MPFIISNMVPSNFLIVSICLDFEELDMFYYMSLVNKKTLQVAKCEYVEFFELCYGIVKAKILHGIR
jgi:hypothetical protein